MADVVSSIVSYLRGKGLPPAAIAGILGNMQTESNFSTSALNGKEGAIGLIQWEGGRRANLQNFAASQGRSETHLQSQLDFMWHELTTDYAGVLQRLRTATNPGDAAAIFDQSYEVSSGSSRGQRIANANQFAASGLSGAGVSGNSYYNAGSEATASAYSSPLGGGASGGAGGGGASTASTAGLTPEQKVAALKAGIGPLASLLATVPELRGLLNEAITSGWTAEEFANKVNNSKWYRTHSDTVRNSLILQASDPASFTQQLGQASAHVKEIADQMGIGLTGPQFITLSKQFQAGILTDAQLQHSIALHFGAGSGPTGMGYKQGMAKGQGAQYDTQLREIYSQYGQNLLPGQMAYRVRSLLAGDTTIDTYKEQAKISAKAMFPGLAMSIDQGMTVKDLAAPYLQQYSNLMEVSPDSVNINNPMIKRALQGAGQAAAGKQPTATPLWQFEQQVKSDPKWQLTKNAHADTSAMLTQLGQDWGFM